VHSFPFTCVSIALLVYKQPVVGVVYEPSSDELFIAVKGHGAYLNGEKISTSPARALKESLVVSENNIHKG
jgi:myo-inositol-1(or 4)-monophosphatase